MGVGFNAMIPQVQGLSGPGSFAASRMVGGLQPMGTATENTLPPGGSGTPRPAYPYGRFLTPIPGFIRISKSLAITTNDHRWEDPDGTVITLKRGFPTDGASLPWLFTIYWSPWDPKVLAAALFHDAGYSLRGTEYDLGPKSVIDQRFYRGMRVAGFRAKRIFWRSVQIAGWPAWWSANNRHVDGYLYALRTNCLDEWISSFQTIPGAEGRRC